MVFVGNVNQSVDVLLKTSSLFDPFPPEMGTDTAFLDRMHCYIPGWEIPKFRPEHFTDDYGFITDYLAEFIRELRKVQSGDVIDRYFKLGKNLTAIMKKLEKESHSKDPNVSAEAQDILSGIDIAREEVKADIDMYREIDPAEAMKIVDLFLKTWPKDESAAELKASLKDLKKAAKDKAKASKDKPEKEENEEKEK